MSADPSPRVLALVVSGCAFVVTALEAVWLFGHVAPAFRGMFEDFGGADALPAWSAAWVGDLSPYLVVVGLAALSLSATVLAHRGGRARLAIAAAAVSVGLAIALPALAYSAFYLPIFAVADGV